jgi:hypothetical protein
MNENTRSRSIKTLAPYRTMPPPGASFMVEFQNPGKAPCFLFSTTDSTVVDRQSDSLFASKHHPAVERDPTVIEGGSDPSCARPLAG